MSELRIQKWKNKTSAHEFIDQADYYILKRKKQFEIMKSLYNYFLNDRIKKITENS